MSRLSSRLRDTAARVASRVGRGHAVAAGLYLVTAVAMLYPQSLRPWDTVWFVGDSLDSVYFLGWNAHQLVTDPLGLFEANILHPHHHAALFDTPRLLPSLVSAPVIWATGNAILGYNLALVAIYLFDALAGRHLSRALGINGPGSWAAGALYAFHTYQISESPRINTVFHGFLPLALGEMVLYLETRERKHAWRVAGLMLLQCLADQYHVIYGALLLSLVVAGVLVARPGRTLGRLAGLVLPATTAVVLVLPLLLGYAEMARVYGYERELPEGVDLRAYESTSPTNVVYGQLGDARLGRKGGPHFVGFVSLGLAIVAVVAWALGRRLGADEARSLLPAATWVPAAALLALLFVALSLGSEIAVSGRTLGPGPYRILYEWVPGFKLLRLPERLALIAMLFVALLVGRALTLLRHWKLSWAAVPLALLVPLEHLSPLPSVVAMPVGDDVPEVYRWLAREEVGAVAELPVHGEGLKRLDTLEEYFSTYHFRPLIHGWVTYEPLLSVLLRSTLGSFPSGLSLQVLQRVGVDTIVVHHGRSRSEGLAPALVAAERRGGIELAARFEAPAASVYEGALDEVYRLSHLSPAPAAPFPEGVPLRDRGWRYQSNRGEPRLVADGDLATAWVAPGELQGDEFIQVTFRGTPRRLAGLVIPVDRRSVLPMGFRVRGKRPDGRWEDLARFDGAHVLQLVDQLLEDPGRAAIGFDLGGRELLGLRLAARGRSFWGWSICELEIWGPDPEGG